MIKCCPLNEICKKFTKLLYCVYRRAYSNSRQGCWTSFKFVKDKNLNDVAMIFFSFKVTL